jgi:hypothetical protein
MDSVEKEEKLRQIRLQRFAAGTQHIFPKELRLSDPELYPMFVAELTKQGMSVRIDYKCNVVVESAFDHPFDDRKYLLLHVNDIIFDTENLTLVIKDIVDNTPTPCRDEYIYILSVFRKYKTKRYLNVNI